MQLLLPALGTLLLGGFSKLHVGIIPLSLTKSLKVYKIVNKTQYIQWIPQSISWISCNATFQTCLKPVTVIYCTCESWLQLVPASHICKLALLTCQSSHNFWCITICLSNVTFWLKTQLVTWTGFHLHFWISHFTHQVVQQGITSSFHPWVQHASFSWERTQL